ncbi:iron(III) transport system ATP-binding protein [Rhizobium sp. BK313]|jgi:iron(III) transport system ATP-binding protein|uniref:ABC transporter ATP-binding protein n=1 Tax=Rhizobium sp. BK313 TaxID=2587081 RepID=UPI00105BD83E|nr:ABC transporter ATP-binding protein [Rhizobium sp. BK313]MBB3456308.1 iron(III) transport system ATP-binding protein [Rhizobium sp. BK313]
MTFVELNKLTKRYGAMTAVNGVDLAIDKGTLVCLLGPSGCGKTTTLRLVAGFIKPSDGRISVGGRVVSSASASEPPEARNMSMIFQSYALWPHMTVFDNVAYGLKLRRLGRADIETRTNRILQATKLANLASRYPSELSGGQQQRVSLARALVVEPETLLLDEPLSNLDANLREEMRFEIRRLHDEFRYTTVYVTHDQTEAMTAANLIVVMKQGNIEQAGTPEDIYERPRSEFVAQFIGGSNIFKGRRVGDNAVDCGEGLVLTCGSGDFPDQGEVAVSIRHHDMHLASERPSGGGSNWASGKVIRQVYLGSHRDYLISLSGGETVRAVAPVNVAIPESQQVWLHCPPDRCRALAR